MPVSPKFCIYGAGAIGGMVGVLLAEAGAGVSVVARGETHAAIKRDGLRMISDGKMFRANPQVSTDPAELGPQDYVIIAVKAPSLTAVAEQIAPLLGPDTAVVTAMNGVPWWLFDNLRGSLAGRKLTAVDPHGVIRRAISTERVIGCVVYISSSLDAPGVVHHHTFRHLLVGEADNRSTPRLAKLVDWLNRAGFQCEPSSDIRADIWTKLLGNLSTNPASLLTAATVDRIVGDPLVRELCARMMDEAVSVGAAIGVRSKLSTNAMISKAREFGAVKTSMLQDAERGSPVEIDALLTVMHDIGQMAGVPTPFIDSVLGLARLRASTLGLLGDAA
jgi:2-dehydropantoate 2-reductase